MRWILPQSVVVAQAGGEPPMRRFWTDGPTLPLWPLLMILGVVVGVLVGRQLWLNYRHARLRIRPLLLFLVVARESGLSRIEQWRLWQIARRTGLTSPITLMICESTLRAHAERATAGLAARTERRLNRAVDRIGDRLFGPAD